MFDIRKVIQKVLKYLFLLLSFVTITVLILALLSEVDGFDLINGKQYIKNIHLLASVIISSGFVIALNSIISRFIREQNPSSTHRGRMQRKEGKYDFIDDMQNDFIDDIPDDIVDDWSNDFIDDMAKDEKLDRFGTLNRKKSSKVKIPSHSQNLVQTIMTYYSGSNIRGNGRPVKVKVAVDGLYYQHYFIPKEKIKSIELNKKNETSIRAMSTNFNLVKFLLFGPLSLLVAGIGEQDSIPAGKELSIKYTENGREQTLLLEGANAPKVAKALRKTTDSFI